MEQLAKLVNMFWTICLVAFLAQAFAEDLSSAEGCFSEGKCTSSINIKEWTAIDDAQVEYN